MALKTTVKSGNKSKAIRQYKTDNPEAKPKEIAGVLSEHGFDVSPQYVSTILSNERRKNGFSTGAITLLGPSRFSVDDMYLAKQLIANTGSAKAAKQAIDCFTKLAD